MKMLIFSSALALCMAGFCADVSPKSAEKGSKEQMRALAQERKAKALAAGKLPRKDSMKGKIAFIDAQSNMGEAEVRKAMSALKSPFEFNYVYETAAPSQDYKSMLKASGATVAVIIINDPKSSSMLISPDEGWAMVNIANLGENLKTDAAKERFLPTRRRKQVVRAFAMVAGGWRSSYPGNLMAAEKVSDLDLVSEALPADVEDRIMRYYKAVGITPQQYVPYRKAAMEGWAPEPTNDVQRAIWNEVYTMPDKPIKIKKNK